MRLILQTVPDPADIVDFSWLRNPWLVFSDSAHLASEAEDEEGAEEDEAGGGEEEAEVEGAVVRGLLDHIDLLPG